MRISIGGHFIVGNATYDVTQNKNNTRASFPRAFVYWFK